MVRQAEGTAERVRQQVRQRLRDAGFEPVQVPAELAARTARGGAKLAARQWRDAAGNSVRMARISSNRAQILNILGLPGDWRRAPLFETELVFFQQTARVIYLDTPLLPGARVERARLRRVLPDLPPELATEKEYLSEFINQNAALQPVFRKNADAAALEIFLRFLPNYLETWLELCQICQEKRVSGKTEGAEPELPEDAANLADFFEHHLTQTPGRLFLSRIFGEQWADDFLRGFMYKHP